MYYIYCYKNKLNGHTYVGQTNNIERRHKEHMTRAFNEKHIEYNSLFHKKIRQYGIDNFTLEILEVLDTIDHNLVDEREIYWIKEKKSFIQDGGYNLTKGGQKGRQYKDDKIDEQKLVQMIKYSNLSLQQIAKEFNLGYSTVKKINKGDLRSYLSNDYPLRKRSIYQVRADRVKELLMTTDLTVAEIMQDTGVSQETVRRINIGETHHDEKLTYPLR